MARMKKSVRVFLIVPAVLLSALLALNWTFYQGDHELLPITVKYREQYRSKITGENVVFSREELGRYVSDDPAFYNEQYYEKYRGLYDKGRPFYVLTPHETLELVSSCGTEEEVAACWENMKWNTLKVYRSGVVIGDGTPWPEAGTAAVLENL